MPFEVRPASPSDLAQLTDIYNHYVVHTPVTFDLQPFTVEQRLGWDVLWMERPLRLPGRA